MFCWRSWERGPCTIHPVQHVLDESREECLISTGKLTGLFEETVLVTNSILIVEFAVLGFYVGQNIEG